MKTMKKASREKDFRYETLHLLAPAWLLVVAAGLMLLVYEPMLLYITKCE